MNLIGLSGEYQSGKDTAGKRLTYIWRGIVCFQSFALKLKKSAAEALGITVEELEWMKLRPEPRIMVQLPGSHDLGGPVGADVGYRIKQITGREYLQWYGTEAHRHVFGTGFWVDQVMNNLSDDPDILNVITDCRFPNEAEAVLEVGGQVWRIHGPDDGKGDHKAHASEQGLAEKLVTRHIDNSVRDDGFRNLDSQLLEAMDSFLKVPR